MNADVCVLRMDAKNISLSQCQPWNLPPSFWVPFLLPCILCISLHPYSSTHLPAHTYTVRGGRWDHWDWGIVLIYRADLLHRAAAITPCVCVCSCLCSLKLCSDHPSLPSSSLVLSGKGSETCTSWRTLLWHNYIFFSTKKWRDVIGQLDCSVEVCLCMFSSLMKEMKSCATMAPAVTFSVWGYCPCCQGNQLLW